MKKAPVKKSKAGKASPKSISDLNPKKQVKGGAAKKSALDAPDYF